MRDANGDLGFRMGSALARWLIEWRWLAIAGALVVALALAAGAARVTVSGDYRAFFDADNPELQAFDALEATYSKLDTLAVVVRPTSGDLFTAERLQALQALTAKLWDLPHASRVDGLANYQHSWAEDDDLNVADLVPEGGALDPAQIRATAMAEPTLRGFLLSSDGTTTSLIVTLHPPAGDDNALSAAVIAARAMVAEFKTSHPAFEVALVGGAVLDTALREVAEHDARTLSPIMLGVLFLGLWVFFRSLTAAGLTSLIVVLAALATLGVMGYSGIPMMSATAAVPVMVLSVAVADAIHLISAVRLELARGAERRAAIIESLAINFEPVVVTSLTTAIGFLSLNFSDAPPYRDVGNLAAAGGLFAPLLTLVLLPALLTMVSLSPAKPRAAMTWFATGLPAWIARQPLLIAFGFVAMALVGTAALPRLHINDKFVDYFAADVSFRQDADFVSRHLPGLYFLEFSLPAVGEGGIHDPAYLERLDAFATWLKAEPGVTHVAAFSDIMKRLNRNMHGDDPAYDRLPESRQAAAQYLLLYEMSLPFGRDLNNQIDVAKSATRVTAVLDDLSTAALLDLQARAGDWLAAHPLPGQAPVNAAAVDGSGLAVIFAHLTERTLISMIWGTATALLFIAGCLLLTLRSWSFAAMSILVNLVPVVLVFGLWAVVKGEIGLYGAAVATVALGLIVDFAIHILSKYKRARAEGAVPPAAIAKAYTMVGPAILVSAGVLILGFGTLLFADFAINAALGLMTALVIATAVVTDLVLLPALLVLFDKEEVVVHAVSERPA